MINQTVGTPGVTERGRTFIAKRKDASRIHPKKRPWAGGSKSYRPAQSSPQTQTDQDSEMAAAMGTRKDLVRADRSKVKCLLHECEWLSLDPPNPRKKLGYGVSLFLQY